VAADKADLILLEAMARAARLAGEAALAARAQGLSIRSKHDDSPVTHADELAEDAVLAALESAARDIPVVAEERVAAGRIPDTDGEFFLVDALDGTKEFIKGGDDFTANIALIRGGVPVLGAVAQPATGALFLGALDHGAWREGNGGRHAIMTRRPAPKSIVAVASKSHRTPETDGYLAHFDVADAVSIGSSLKFCLVAEGRADLYPRLGRTMEWDTAAGHAVLIAAGGGVLMLDGAPLPYGKRNQAQDSDFANPHFVAVGDVALLES
jgi:3'(2'), 5'-bisphosphate nucleotidase